jgi:hypothetical protein
MGRATERDNLIKQIREILPKKRNIIPGKTYISYLEKLAYLSIGSQVGKLQKLYNDILMLNEEVKTKEQVKTKTKEIKKVNQQLKAQELKLSSSLWIINLPKDYQRCMNSLAVEPQLRTSLLKKVKSYYFYDITSLHDIKQKISDIYAIQTKMFKISLSLGFVYEVHKPDDKIKFIYSSSRPSNSKFLFQGQLIKKI